MKGGGEGRRSGGNSSTKGTSVVSGVSRVFPGNREGCREHWLGWSSLSEAFGFCLPVRG